MRYVQIDSPKPISKIGLGTSQFGSSSWGYGTAYEQTARQIVRRALELGVTLFDTAEVYAEGASERILAAALGEDRESVVLATKIWPRLLLARVVRQRAAASAGRLGTGRIDLYQVHHASRRVSDRTLMRGMRSLQDQGLVGEVGVSNYSLQRWQSAEARLGRRVLSNQVQYNLFTTGPEHDLLPYAQRAGRLVIAYSPLARGLVSGRYDAQHLPSGPVRQTEPLFRPENLARAAGLLATLREVADAHQATTSQIALAYLLRHPSVVAIPGASSVEQMEHNAAAADIDLTDDEHAALSGAARVFRPVAA